MASVPLKRPYRLRLFGLIVSAFTGMFIIVTVWFAFTLSLSSNDRVIILIANSINPSRATFLLRFFSEAVNLLFGVLLGIILNAVL